MALACCGGAWTPAAIHVFKVLTKGGLLALVLCLLLLQVAVHGTKKWALIASRLKTKKGKQCRRRWQNVLNADNKTGGWSAEEGLAPATNHNHDNNMHNNNNDNHNNNHNIHTTPDSWLLVLWLRLCLHTSGGGCP